MERCLWAQSNERMQVYHDTVWGVPEYDDQRLFRKLMLDINQAGLSWQTILNKSDAFDQAYENFDIQKVAAFDQEKIEVLVEDVGIIRNRRKIEAAIVNAQQVLKIQEEKGSFSNYLWSFVDGKPVDGQRKNAEEIPANNELSDAVAKDLKKRGFKFVGSTTIYAFMQAVGMFNDHQMTCFRYEQVKKGGCDISSL